MSAESPVVTETIVNPASKTVRQSPLSVVRPQYEEHDPRRKLPGYSRNKVDHLWDWCGARGDGVEDWVNPAEFRIAGNKSRPRGLQLSGGAQP
jgi:hypothetical protein